AQAVLRAVGAVGACRGQGRQGYQQEQQAGGDLKRAQQSPSRMQGRALREKPDAQVYRTWRVPNISFGTRSSAGSTGWWPAWPTGLTQEQPPAGTNSTARLPP